MRRTPDARRRLRHASAILAFVALQAGAQDMQVPSVTTADPGMLFPNDAAARRAEERATNKGCAPSFEKCPRGVKPAAPKPFLLDSTRKASPSGIRATTPSVSAVADAEIARMKLEYAHRIERDGRESADQWVREQGRRTGAAARRDGDGSLAAEIGRRMNRPPSLR